MTFKTEIEKIEKAEKTGFQNIKDEFNQLYNTMEEGHQFARAWCLEIEKQFGTKPNYTIRKRK